MEKYVYIKKSIAKHFVDFAEPLRAEEYNNLGSTWLDYLDNLWVLLSDSQVAFYIEHPTASVKEVFDMEMTPIPVIERTLEDAKQEKINQIDEYDRSSSVNGFTLNDNIEGWFTSEQRSNYRSSIDSAKILEINNLQFFVGDILLDITVAQAEYMLSQIQHYADQCYIVTKQHKLAIEALDTIEAVDAYDYTSGYPLKINFTYPVSSNNTEE